MDAGNTAVLCEAAYRRGAHQMLCGAIRMLLTARSADEGLRRLLVAEKVAHGLRMNGEALVRGDDMPVPEDPLATGGLVDYVETESADPDVVARKERETSTRFVDDTDLPRPMPWWKSTPLARPRTRKSRLAR
jgi:hypothetical protein